MARKNADLPGLGDRIRQARDAAGLSQAQVAKLLGLHRPAVTGMESGTRKVTAGELATLADLYKVSLDWLAGSEGRSSTLTMAARKLRDLKERDLQTALRIIDSLWRGGKNRR